MDYPDNHIRFAVLCRAALGVARYVFRPDIFHCHDWQAGLVPGLPAQHLRARPDVSRRAHSLHHPQPRLPGAVPASTAGQLGLDPALLTPDGLEFFGKLSFIKGGLVYSDALNTVSPTYAREIQTPEYGFGLDGVLRARSDSLCGILNGVDYSEWNPETDPHIAANYSVDDLSGKRVCKRALLRDFGLAEEAMDRPLVGIVSRFTRQKGADLVAEAAPETGGARLFPGGARHGRAGVREAFHGPRSGASRPHRRARWRTTTRWRIASRRARTSSSCPAATSRAA